MRTHFKTYDFKSLIKRWNSGKQLVAMHFTDTVLRLVLVSAGSAGQEVSEIYSLELPQELSDYAWLNNATYLSSYVKANVNSSLFTGRQAVAVVDTEQTCLRELNMPMLNSAELAQAVQWDAVQQLPYNEAEYTYDYLSAKWENNEGEGLKVSLVATTIRLTQAVQLVAAGLDLELVKIAGSALALREFVNHQQPNLALVELGSKSTQLTIFEGVRPTHQISIALGTTDFAALVAAQCQISLAQANILLKQQREISSLLNSQALFSKQIHTLLLELTQQISIGIEQYTLNKSSLTIELIVSAGMVPALNTAFNNLLKDKLNLYSETIRPFEQFLTAEHLHISSLDMEYGIALGGILMLNHNSTFTLARTNSRVSNAQVKSCKLVLLVGVVLLLFLCGYELIVTNLYKNDYAQLTANNSRLIVWRKRKELLNNLETDIARREAQLSKLAEERTAWPQILLALGYNIPDGLSISGISRVKEADSYLLRGKTDNIQAVSTFVTALQKTGAFQQIKLQHVGESGINNSGEFIINLKGMGKVYAKDQGTIKQIQ